MAELKFKYVSDIYCSAKYVPGNICEQCFTDAADALGCRQYDDGTRKWREENSVKLEYMRGECIYAQYEYSIKGIKASNYNIEHFSDPYTNCSGWVLTIGKKEYMCEWIMVDGEDVNKLFFPGED